MTSLAAIDPAFCGEAFSLTPDPQRLFLSRDHAEALAALKLGLDYRRGLLVVVGEVGMGKTTVAYSLLAALGDEVRTAYIANTHLPFDGLLRHALEDFGVECREHDRASLLSALNAFLLECARAGRMAVLVVDEAQSLDDDTVENLRLLSNVETYRQKLLQIILLGQPELDAKLRMPHLRQIADRVAVRVNINPLDAVESRRYIAHRLERAGGSLEMLSGPALRLIVKHARGVPRRMNILCHNALLLAYATGTAHVTRSMAREAIRERSGGKVVLLPRRMSAASPLEARRGTRWWRWTATALALGGLGLAAGLSFQGAPRSETGASAMPSVAPPERAIPPATGRPADTARRDDAPAAEPEAAREAPGPALAAGPPREPVADRSAATHDAADTPQAVQITVDEGATLVRIARRFYGHDSPELIHRIMEANPAVSDANVILAGSTLILPGASAEMPTTKGESQS